MSAVRYFDDVPHIVRYGMLDEKDESCWVLFWRNGVQFTIHVDKKDVHNTTFYSAWRPLLRERLKAGETVKEHGQNQWHSLCDLVISHSMATLQELAPDKPYWITLRDYLHTPCYSLKLVADRESDHIYAEVTKGPEEQGAYDFQPLIAGEFRNMPKDIAHYDSSELVVLEKAENWKTPPQKVRTSDGHVCFFKACQRSSTSIETGEVTNHSLDSINVYLKLFKVSQELHSSYTARSRLLGVVIDAYSTPSESALDDQKLPEYTERTYQHEARMTESLVAGILLPSITHRQTLATVIEQIERTTLDTVVEQSRSWKTQIEEETAQLHSLGIYWGGRDDWYNINQHTILIDAEGNASLDMDVATSIDDSRSKDLGIKGVAMDIKAIEALFKEWLPREIANRSSKSIEDV